MITVLGVGNILLSDEGLGVRAVEEFKKRYVYPQNVNVLDGGTLGIDLMYFIEGSEKLLIVDAVFGGNKPGTFYRIENENVKKYFKSKVSMHELGIQEVLALLELTGKPVEEIVVLGLEPKSLEVSTSLTPEIEEKIPLLVREIANQLKKWGVDLEEKMESLKFLEKLEKVDKERLKDLINRQETFVLYVRSKRLYEKIKEIFDVDVIFPELAKSFNGIKFVWGDMDELGVKGMAPLIVIFREGREIKRIEGIKNWADYVSALKEALLC